MGIARLITFLALLPTSVVAQDMNFDCRGTNWSVVVEGETALMSVAAPVEMEIPLITPAQGFDWPKAITLIGNRDSAILIVDKRQCNSLEYSAELLTQVGQTPLFMVGCCQKN